MMSKFKLNCAYQSHQTKFVITRLLKYKNFETVALVLLDKLPFLVHLLFCKVIFNGREKLNWFTLPITYIL